MNLEAIEKYTVRPIAVVGAYVADGVDALTGALSAIKQPWLRYLTLATIGITVIPALLSASVAVAVVLVLAMAASQLLVSLHGIAKGNAQPEQQGTEATP